MSRSLRIRVALNHVLVVIALTTNILFYFAIQNLREKRVRDQQQADLINCARVNASDRRNKNQDRTLLNLVEAAQSRNPSSFRKVAANEKQSLRGRVANKGAPNDLHEFDFIRPRNCRKLPSQRKFEK